MNFIKKAVQLGKQAYSKVVEGGRNLAVAAAVGFASAGSVLPQPAQAAIAATDVDPVVTEITTDATLIFTKFIVAVGTVLAMSIGIKLIKRFGNKV